MFLVKLLWETEGQLHPLVDVHPHLPCVAQVMVDVTSQLEHLHERQVMARWLLSVVRLKWCSWWSTGKMLISSCAAMRLLICWVRYPILCYLCVSMSMVMVVFLTRLSQEASALRRQGDQQISPQLQLKLAPLTPVY